MITIGATSIAPGRGTVKGRYDHWVSSHRMTQLEFCEHRFAHFESRPLPLSQNQLSCSSMRRCWTYHERRSGASCFLLRTRHVSHQCQRDIALDHLLFQSGIELLNSARESHLSGDAIDGLLLEKDEQARLPCPRQQRKGGWC
jgi:hypothetical protein